jgi:hypothetical protein
MNVIYTKWYSQSGPQNVWESTCETVSSPGSVRDGRTHPLVTGLSLIHDNHQ